MEAVNVTTWIRCGPQEVWKALVDFPSWSRWTPGNIDAQGEAVVGSRLDFRMRSASGQTWRFRPRVVEAVEPRRLVLEVTFGPPRLLHLSHSFELQETHGPTTRFDQSMRVTGLLASRGWPRLRDHWPPLAEFGQALSRRVTPAPPELPFEDWEWVYVQRGLDFDWLRHLVAVPGLEQHLCQLLDDPEAGFAAALQKINEGREYYRLGHNMLGLDPTETQPMLLYLDYLEEKLRRRRDGESPSR